MEMEKREMKWERQQHIKEEFMEAAARRKGQIWEENWRIREKEHKEELKKQEEKIMERDVDLLNILKKKETEMENNMLRKIEGFKHLYKELFKEFERLMKDRDQ